MVVLKKQAHGACNGRPGTSINRHPVSRRPISHARARRYLREHWRIGSGAGACEIQVSLLVLQRDCSGPDDVCADRAWQVERQGVRRGI